MKNAIRFGLVSILTPMVKNHVYTQKAGLATGLKRRGGFGFLPLKKVLTREQLFLRGLDFKGKTVYDVGGYIGLVTLFFARQVGETGQVITFEPNPQNYKAILDHVNLNGFSNIRVIPLGLSSQSETLKFVVSGPARGTADPTKQKSRLAQKDEQIIQIEVDTLDHQILINQLPRPDFVKIDVEGLEIEVLRGMTQTITNHKPAIFLELHGTAEREVVTFLLSHQYRVHQVEDDIELTNQNLDRVHGHLYAD
jgi:FkbM family methyltransferase